MKRQVTGTLNVKDYVSGQQLHLRTRPIVSLLIWVAPAIILLNGLLSLYFADELHRWPVMVCLVIFILVPIAGYRYIFLPRKFRQAFEQQQAMLLPTTVTFDDEGLQVSNDLGQGLTPWAHLTKYRENKELFLLYRLDGIMHIIPKRFFGDQEQIVTLRDLLAKHNVKS
jgi:hypothetical protein